MRILSTYFFQFELRELWFMVPFTVYPKKYAHGFCFAVLCCGYTWNDFPISIRLTLLALWQSNDCPSASKATLMNMDKYFMWIHYERLHNHNKAKHNKTVCIFLGIYCSLSHCHINKNPVLTSSCTDIPEQAKDQRCYGNLGSLEDKIITRVEWVKLIEENIVRFPLSRSTAQSSSTSPESGQCAHNVSRSILWLCCEDVCC